MSEDPAGIRIQHPIVPPPTCRCGDPDCQWVLAWDVAMAQLSRAINYPIDYAILMGRPKP